MNRFAVSFLTVLLVGCHPKQVDVTGPESGTESITLFQKNKGILLPAEIRQQFGLEVAEVAQKPMRRQFQKLAQVFRSASGDAPGEATVMLTHIESKGLKPGQSVLIKAADSDDAMSASLLRVDEHAQSALGQLEALIEFPDALHRFPVGTFLTATFTGDAKSSLVIPAAALLQAADGTFVYVANGEHFTRTKIKTGATSEGYVEIEDGLYAGDVVVTRGIGSLWLIELSALKGGKPCCVAPKKAI